VGTIDNKDISTKDKDKEKVVPKESSSSFPEEQKQKDNDKGLSSSLKPIPEGLRVKDFIAMFLLSPEVEYLEKDFIEGSLHPDDLRKIKEEFTRLSGFPKDFYTPTDFAHGVLCDAILTLMRNETNYSPEILQKYIVEALKDKGYIFRDFEKEKIFPKEKVPKRYSWMEYDEDDEEEKLIESDISQENEKILFNSSIIPEEDYELIGWSLDGKIIDDLLTSLGDLIHDFIKLPEANKVYWVESIKEDKNNILKLRTKLLYLKGALNEK